MSKFKKVRLRRSAAIASSLAAVLVLAACTSGGSDTAASAESTEPVKVGVLTDMTGAFGIVGKSNEAVAKFTINEINANGGVLGRQLEMVLADSATDAAIATQVANRLVNQHMKVANAAPTFGTQVLLQINKWIQQ